MQERAKKSAAGSKRTKAFHAEPSGLKWRARVERTRGRAYLLEGARGEDGTAEETLTWSDPEAAEQDAAAAKARADGTAGAADGSGSAAAGANGAAAGGVAAGGGASGEPAAAVEQWVEDSCERCHEFHSYPGNELLLCDGADCGTAFHLHCLRPKLLVVPQGLW